MEIRWIACANKSHPVNDKENLQTPAEVLAPALQVTESSQSHNAPLDDADLCFYSPPARHQLTLRDHIYAASASYGIPIYSMALANTHGTYAWTDEWLGQPELLVTY